MPDYRTLKDKSTTDADDDRAIFYGIGECGYWTDDWSKLSTHRGIPSCPICGNVGRQVTAREFFRGLQDFEDKSNPRYVEFMTKTKESCDFKRFIRRYPEWLKAQRRVVR
jgi:hypothetical protein